MDWKVSIHDMNRIKQCEQYDSNSSAEGQAYDVQLTSEISGWKELTFSLPKTANGQRNFRWDYIRSGYLVRLLRDGVADWFLMESPKRSHKGMLVSATVTCDHVCSLLNKKSIYLTFDDTNGIGTAQYLLGQVLAGTGWQLGFCETFYETDGTTEKVRSISSDSKRGAFMLISDICKLFSGRPEFDGDTRTVNIYSLNRHEDVLELNFGKNLTSIDRKEDATNVVTRLYVEGEYGDNGYVGIDEVNPTGLSFLLNFDYYRELGVFTAAHEQALADYLRDIATAKTDSSDTVQELIQIDNQQNELWGQIDYIIYALENGAITRTILGGESTQEQAGIESTDELTVLMVDGTYRQLFGNDFPPTSEYAVKWIKKASAVIGGKEVAIEAKSESIQSLHKQMDKETDEAKQQALREQITAQEASITAFYVGDDTTEGLYSLMRRAVLLAIDRADTELQYDASLSGQEAIEQRFAQSMGDMLRDGYWSNTSYAPGQEELLYLEASEIMEKQAKPAVTYNVTIQNLSGVSGYEQERFSLNAALRIWDEWLGQNDWAYVTKLVEHAAKPEKDSITISNDLSSVGGLSLDSVIARITGIAETLNNKKALYDRSKAISVDGSIPAKRLEGMIDVLKTRLSSSISSWYTDENGNLILESVNGRSVMKLCGEGFMIASEKNDDGTWDWRTFGTGEGFTADLIVAGFLSADRIQAHTITTKHLASDVGESLDLSSNTSIRMTVENAVVTAVGYRLEITTDRGDVLSEHVPQTTLRARVWYGNTEVTDTIDAARFRWTRSSQDTTADALWNAAHTGMKQITLTTQDVLYSATYSCEIVTENPNISS